MHILHVYVYKHCISYRIADISTGHVEAHIHMTAVYGLIAVPSLSYRWAATVTSPCEVLSYRHIALRIVINVLHFRSRYIRRLSSNCAGKITIHIKSTFYLLFFKQSFCSFQGGNRLRQHHPITYFFRNILVAENPRPTVHGT